MAKWALLVVLTVAVTVPLTIVGVPSAALFAALVVGIALALPSLPNGYPVRPALPHKVCSASTSAPWFIAMR